MSASQTPPPDDPPPWAKGTEGRDHEIFPKLTPEETDIVRSYGTEKRFDHGTRLWDVGDDLVPLYLVLEGEIEVLRYDEDGEHVTITYSPSQYSGELVTMSGRRSFVGGRAKGWLRAIVVPQESLRELLALEAELGEKILLSFILRRMEMVAKHRGDVVLVGDSGNQQTEEIELFLSLNAVPYHMISPYSDEDAERRARIGFQGPDWPVFICGKQRLVRPSIKEIGDCLGLTARVPSGAKFDLAIIGAGPSGLAAAVYAASEGLKVVVFERRAVGGQAGTSSRIENYMGFPTGISGMALTGRGFLQAQKFGAEVAIAREAVSLQKGDIYHRIGLENGDHIFARSALIATGAAYRQPKILRVAEFEGIGVHYGAGHLQGMLCRKQNVAILGGGNSAGQAAVFLARRANKVSILIRRDSLHASMSNYLIRRIEHTPNIEVLPLTEVVSIEGRQKIESLRIRNTQTGERGTLNASHLFIFIGAVPASSFTGGSVLLDESGFIKTGDHLTDEDLASAGWSLKRRPYLLETSSPRIFAAGDVRAGSVKRVASAVGEGSVCVQFIHQVLNELHAREPR